VLFLTDFTLHTRISAIFLLSVEVLVTDSESQTPISYSSLIVTMTLSGLVFEISARDNPIDDDKRRQTKDSIA